MEKDLFGIPNADVYLVIGVTSFFIFMEVCAGFWASSKRTFGDWIQELGSFLVLGFLSKPAIVLVVLFLSNTFIPQYKYLLSGMNFWVALVAYLLVDDFLQYCYHRAAHEYPFLWKLHRTHHQAEEMGFFVSYRNAALYYLLMPNIWWIGFFTFLGGAKAVAIALVLKQLIIISSHSTVHYDRLLYKYKILNPLITVWERIFITPAFHHAHHGRSPADGVSDPNGNFGNMFSIWDQLFGTATYTRKFPAEYGLVNDPHEHWTAAYLYPLVAANNPDSELSRGHRKVESRLPIPKSVDLEEGKNYLWCQCGLSKNQPFCDGSHQGTKAKPIVFQVKKTGSYKMCCCKATKSKPYCDNSHVALDSTNRLTKQNSSHSAEASDSR